MAVSALLLGVATSFLWSVRSRDRLVRDESGRTIEVADPLAATFASIADAHRGDPAAHARALLGVTAVFGDDLPQDPRFTRPVTAWLAALHAQGASRTVQDCNARP